MLFTQKILALPKSNMKQRSNNLLFYQQFLSIFRKKRRPRRAIKYRQGSQNINAKFFRIAHMKCVVI
ncbi:hypothetical protein EGH56_05985 [Klebsiella aerogenes]|nr:hypothetical protein EGH56_05985 [Klebsiella aerogenes]RSW48135.1 hypothetical protein EGH44_13220 [Klebsiella aerogenes]